MDSELRDRRDLAWSPSHGLSEAVSYVSLAFMGHLLYAQPLQTQFPMLGSVTILALQKLRQLRLRWKELGPGTGLAGRAAGLGTSGPNCWTKDPTLIWGHPKLSEPLKHSLWVERDRHGWDGTETLFVPSRLVLWFSTPGDLEENLGLEPPKGWGLSGIRRD